MRFWRCYLLTGRELSGEMFNAYVGQSCRSLDARVYEHKVTQPWGLEIVGARWLAGVFDSEEEALFIEAQYIKRALSRFNWDEQPDLNPNRINPYTMRWMGGPNIGQPYRPDLYRQPFCWEGEPCANAVPGPVPAGVHWSVRSQLGRPYVTGSAPIARMSEADWQDPRSWATTPHESPLAPWNNLHVWVAAIYAHSAFTADKRARTSSGTDRQPSWSTRLRRLPARYQAAFWILLFLALVILAATNR